jgi:DNA-binding NarL/FixJ family response regulator
LKVNTILMRLIRVATLLRSDDAGRGRDGRPVVALIAGDERRLRRIVAALHSSGIEVCAGPQSARGAEGSLPASADIAAVACDPFRAEQAEDLRRLRRTLPAVALLIVAPGARDAAPVVRRALSLGADGVVLERDLERTLAPTVLALAQGQMAVPRAGRRSLQKPQLSHREKQVLGLAVSGHTNAEIGARLHLAESTVKTHLTSAFRRLGVASRREAAALLLDPDEGLGPAVLAGTQPPGAGPASP